jgi:hypothetical protein
LGFDAAARGATERLVPILMTGLVTGLGLFPLAIGSGAAGREIEGPMGDGDPWGIDYFDASEPARPADPRVCVTGGLKRSRKTEKLDESLRPG